MSAVASKMHLPLAEVRIMPQHGVRSSLTPSGRDAVVQFLDDLIVKLKAKKCNGYSFEQPDSIYRLKLTRS